MYFFFFLIVVLELTVYIESWDYPICTAIPTIVMIRAKVAFVVHAFIK